MAVIQLSCGCKCTECIVIISGIRNNNNANLDFHDFHFICAVPITLGGLASSYHGKRCFWSQDALEAAYIISARYHGGWELVGYFCVVSLVLCYVK